MSAESPPDALVDEMAAFLRALAEPMRLKILHALRDGERRGTDLLSVLDCSQANLSRHLSVLRAAGILNARRDGASTFFSIADSGVFRVCDVVCSSLDRAVRERARVVGGSA